MDEHTTTEFITSSRKHSRSAEFACYVRNLTDRALRLTVPFGALEDAPRMNKEAHSRLLAVNRERYGVEPGKENAATDSQSSSPSAGPAAKTTAKPKRRDPDAVDMHATET